jgi:hypothetical protein
MGELNYIDSAEKQGKPDSNQDIGAAEHEGDENNLSEMGHGYFFGRALVPFA